MGEADLHTRADGGEAQSKGFVVHQHGMYTESTPVCGHLPVRAVPFRTRAPARPSCGHCGALFVPARLLLQLAHLRRFFSREGANAHIPFPAPAAAPPPVCRHQDASLSVCIVDTCDGKFVVRPKEEVGGGGCADMRIGVCDPLLQLILLHESDQNSTYRCLAFLREVAVESSRVRGSVL